MSVVAVPDPHGVFDGDHEDQAGGPVTGARRRDAVFWVVMTVVAAAVAIAYAAIGWFGQRWGISADRARRFRSSSYLAAGWTAVCVGQLLTHR